MNCNSTKVKTNRGKTVANSNQQNGNGDAMPLKLINE